MSSARFIRRFCTDFLVRELIGALESEALGCQYILGVRMRSTGEVEEKVLRDKSPWMVIQPERERAKDPSPLKVREVRVDGRRYVVGLNEEQRRKDVADCEALWRPCATPWPRAAENR